MPASEMPNAQHGNADPQGIDIRIRRVVGRIVGAFSPSSHPPSSPGFGSGTATSSVQRPGRALMRLAARVDDRIEARAFMPEDFNAGDPLASEIRRTGVQVA